VREDQAAAVLGDGRHGEGGPLSRDLLAVLDIGAALVPLEVQLVTGELRGDDCRNRLVPPQGQRALKADATAKGSLRPDGWPSGGSGDHGRTRVATAVISHQEYALRYRWLPLVNRDSRGDVRA
jgi:hypothetical protein